MENIDLRKEIMGYILDKKQNLKDFADDCGLCYSVINGFVLHDRKISFRTRCALEKHVLGEIHFTK